MRFLIFLSINLIALLFINYFYYFIFFIFILFVSDYNSNVTRTPGGAMVRRRRTFHGYVVKHFWQPNGDSFKFLNYTDNREKSRESRRYWRWLVASILGRSYYLDSCAYIDRNT